MQTFLGSLFLILTPIFAEKVENSIISANNRFAADIYKELAKNQEANFLVSPFSVESGLAFVQSGARGQTGEELRTTLYLPHNQTQIENEFKNIFPSFKSKDNIHSFNSANKLYLDKNFSIKDDFRKIAVEVFDADLENIEFLKSAEAAKKINQWVEDKTGKKIRNLVDSGGLDPSTVAVIINALYFNGKWVTAFSESNTGKKNFYHIDKKNSPVDTMHLDITHRTFNYGENQELDAKFLEMSFEEGGISMVFALPNNKDGISDLEKQIDKVFSFNTFTSNHVKISLPKFKIESKIDLKDVLQKLGVKKAFACGVADFSGISDGNLCIDQAIQKTFINVSENGVEAAAASIFNFLVYAEEAQTPPKEFKADHPFIYFIKVKGLIVFAGRVGAPQF